MRTTLFAGLLIFCAVFSLHAEEPPASHRPNVLFLICDDLNCDLGCYGHPIVQSPHIDRLAARGVRFDQAYCQYPLCGPSRASFMTGLYPDQTLIRQNTIAIRETLPRVVSLTQCFRNEGYFATRIGKIYHYNVPRNIGTGGQDDPDSWDVTINPRGRDKTDEALVFSLVPGEYGGTLSWLAAAGTDEEQTDGIAATEAIRVLEQHADQDEPFFLAVGLFRPHTPFVAPQKYFDMYPPESLKVPETPDDYLQTLPAPAQKSLTVRRSQLNLPTEVARQAIQAYYASISFADAQLGRILDALDRTGLADRTIVVLTSDHGYHMGEHGTYQKTTLFENADRVPLIIATPQMKHAGQTAQSLAEMVDFFPTLAELAGIDPPDGLAGVSLVPALDDPTFMARTSALTQYAGGYSLRTPTHRYTEWGPQGKRGKELYDCQVDPAEMSNVAGQVDPQTETALAQLLQQRVQQARACPEGLVQMKRVRVAQQATSTPSSR